MRKTASEILRNLDLRIARLEKQSSTLSNDAKAMMNSLANHSRKTPMSKKGNFNVLQEVLEALGFSCEYKDVHKSAMNIPSLLPNGLVEDLSSIYPTLQYFGLATGHTDESEAKEFFAGLARKITQLPKVEGIPTKKPKSTPFGKVNLHMDDDSPWIQTNGRGETRCSWAFTPYVGLKNVVISKGGKKVSIQVTVDSDLTDFDLSKAISFAIKQGAQTDALAFSSPASVGTGSQEPELSLLEQGKGSCCFCGAIHRLNRRGGVHRHGYRAVGWAWTADCYGTNHPPYEVSADGLKEVKKILAFDISTLEKRLDAVSTTLANMTDADSARDRIKARREVDQLKGYVRSAHKQLEMCDQKIKTWRPQA